MNIFLEKEAAKYLEHLNEPVKGRIKTALRKLAADTRQSDIKSMTNKDGYRLRVGKYRILFDMNENGIIVYEIGLRGQIYKRKG